MNEYIKAMQDQIASLKSEVMFLIGAVKEKTIIIIIIIIIIVLLLIIMIVVVVIIIIIIIIIIIMMRIMTILTKVVKYFLIIKLHLLKITMVML